MKPTIFVLFACVLSPAVYARDLPKDGNDLLEYCSAMVDVADNPSNLAAITGDKLTEKIGQVDWCAGYLAAVQDLLIQVHVNLAIIVTMGVTLEGPDIQTKQYALNQLRIACVPDENVRILQLGRVLIKWLREHPERLHEPKTILATDALRDSFPCQQPNPKEAPKPAPPK
jgi:hypothetical protein